MPPSWAGCHCASLHTSGASLRNHSAGFKTVCGERLPSLVNGGRFGNDWHASGKGWFSQNLYLDAAHYVKADQSAATADYRNSYHVKLASGVSLEPYGHLQVNGLCTDHIARDVRFGVGSRWNVWLWREPIRRAAAQAVDWRRIPAGVRNLSAGSQRSVPQREFALVAAG